MGQKKSGLKDMDGHKVFLFTFNLENVIKSYDLALLWAKIC